HGRKPLVLADDVRDLRRDRDIAAGYFLLHDLARPALVDIVQEGEHEADADRPYAALAEYGAGFADFILIEGLLDLARGWTDALGDGDPVPALHERTALPGYIEMQ